MAAMEGMWEICRWDADWINSFCGVMTWGVLACPGGSERKVISADKHIVKLWDATSGETFTNLQPQEPGINDVLHWKDSGLIMLGMDAPRIQAFTPALTHILVTST